jgi:hypothetical protein
VQRKPGAAWLLDEAKRIQAETGCMVAINAKGPASDLIPAFENAGVDLTVVGLDDYIEACALVFDRVRDRTLTHAATTDLDEAVRVAAWRSIGERRAFGHKMSAGHIEALEACTLAAWVAVELDYDVLDSVL